MQERNLNVSIRLKRKFISISSQVLLLTNANMQTHLRALTQLK